MARPTARPTGNECTFGEDEIIVSKTDLKGQITYANKVFLRMAGFNEDDLLGAPHNLIRHPDMPRCVFKLLWDTVEQGNEIFAYVINLARNGDHYWVFAHVTPTFDENGEIVGYHSNRRVPEPATVEKVKQIYELLLQEEQKHSSPKDGIEVSTQLLLQVLSEQGLGYEEFVWSL